MNHFTITELYEISDGLTERRTRLLNMRKQLQPTFGTSDTFDRMIDAAQSAHTKIMDEIVTRTSTL
jgi:hypothetical protein